MPDDGRDGMKSQPGMACPKTNLSLTFQSLYRTITDADAMPMVLRLAQRSWPWSGLNEFHFQDDAAEDVRDNDPGFRFQPCAQVFEVAELHSLLVPLTGHV